MKIIFTVLVMIFSHWIIFVESNDDMYLCAENRFDIISLEGNIYYGIYSYYKTLYSNHSVIQIKIVYNIYTEDFIEWDTRPMDEFYKPQSAFYIPQCGIHKEEDCGLVITEDQFKFSLMKTDISVVFQFKLIDRIWERFVKVQYFSGLDFEKPIYEIQTKLWPQKWAEVRTDAEFIGSCTFSRLDDMLVFVINSQDVSQNAILFTKTLKDLMTNKDFTETSIPNSAGKRFISVFYWIISGEVLAQVIKRGEIRTTAPIYKLNLKGNKKFTEKGSVAKDLWRCAIKTDSNNEIIVFTLLFITILVLVVSIGVICYFVFFLIIRKQKDPIFGFKGRRIRNQRTT